MPRPRKDHLCQSCCWQSYNSQQFSVIVSLAFAPRAPVQPVPTLGGGARPERPLGLLLQRDLRFWPSSSPRLHSSFLHISPHLFAFLIFSLFSLFLVSCFLLASFFLLVSPLPGAVTFLLLFHSAVHKPGLCRRVTSSPFRSFSAKGDEKTQDVRKAPCKCLAALILRLEKKKNFSGAQSL